VWGSRNSDAAAIWVSCCGFVLVDQAPRIGWHLICSWPRSGTAWLGRGGRGSRARCGQLQCRGYFVSTVRLPLVKIDMSSALSAPNLSAKQFDCGQRAGSAGRGCLLAENRVLYLLTRAAVGVVPTGYPWADAYTFSADLTRRTHCRLPACRASSTGAHP
jgi:hypothetical protein